MRKRVVTLALISLFSFNYIFAQCIKGDCFNGEGTFRAKNGSTYQGTFKLGKFHGKGFVTFSSNDKFIGSFSNGKKNGTGKYIFAAGHEYIGEFVNDKRQGKGKMTYSNHDVYLGDWQNDMPQGQGKYLFADGSSFSGKFTNGNFDGNGTFTEANGESYTGTWKNNVLIDRNSQEIVQNSTNVNTSNTQSHTNSTTNKIKNCTDQYCDSEIGRFDYRDGSYYIGDFIKGEPEGEGTCNYINGDIYKGGWKSHGPHGFGTMLKKDGSVHSGIWELGALKKRSYETEALTKIKQQKEKKTSEFNSEINIYAVIVGVATYNHMQSLRYTDDDAYHLYAFLKSPEGGAIPDDHISILIDDAATKKNISKEISNIFSKADANDVIMLYMSGHGLEGSFVPVDFDGTNNLLAYKDVLDLINESPAKHKLYITDACHSGSMYAAKSPYDMALTDFYTKFKNVKGGTAIITSSKKDEVSLEYSGMRHGVFSHYLINGLKGDANTNGDQFVSVEELFNYIFLNVRNHTNNAQTPSIFGDYDKDMPVGVIR